MFVSFQLAHDSTTDYEPEELIMKHPDVGEPEEIHSEEEDAASVSLEEQTSERTKADAGALLSLYIENTSAQVHRCN